MADMGDISEFLGKYVYPGRIPGLSVIMLGFLPELISD